MKFVHALWQYVEISPSDFIHIGQGIRNAEAEIYLPPYLKYDGPEPISTATQAWMTIFVNTSYTEFH
jgi:hypothetical protein